jgi:hypothetical protein
MSVAIMTMAYLYLLDGLLISRHRVLSRSIEINLLSVERSTINIRMSLLFACIAMMQLVAL